jgi:hypothetical protein
MGVVQRIQPFATLKPIASPTRLPYFWILNPIKSEEHLPDVKAVMEYNLLQTHCILQIHYI